MADILDPSFSPSIFSHLWQRGTVWMFMLKDHIDLLKTDILSPCTSLINKGTCSCVKSTQVTILGVACWPAPKKQAGCMHPQWQHLQRNFTKQAKALDSLLSVQYHFDSDLITVNLCLKGILALKSVQLTVPFQQNFTHLPVTVQQDRSFFKQY